MTERILGHDGTHARFYAHGKEEEKNMPEREQNMPEWWDDETTGIMPDDAGYAMAVITETLLDENTFAPGKLQAAICIATLYHKQVQWEREDIGKKGK